jgi:hypothetical protein
MKNLEREATVSGFTINRNQKEAEQSASFSV